MLSLLVAIRVPPSPTGPTALPLPRTVHRSIIALLALALLGCVLAGCTIAESESNPVDVAGAETQTPQPQTIEAPSTGANSTAAAPEIAAPGPPSASVLLADLTSPEIRQRLDQGTTTILIPTGGIEQNGPHMALDKHQVVVAYTAEMIAARAGNTLVAPVMAYVPEGDPAVMDNHLQWAGTISVTEDIFAQVLESVSTSLANEGFTTIAFVGDSGSSQAVQSQVAATLTAQWADRSITVINLDQYYQAGSDSAPAVAAGVDPSEVGTHAGVLDTSQVLALDPDLVRGDQLRPSGSAQGLTSDGFDGDPTRASAAIGQAVLEAKIQAGVAQLSAAR